MVLVQSCVRRFLARRELKQLKVEARSIGHFKKLNVKLEMRIAELQVTLSAFLVFTEEYST